MSFSQWWPLALVCLLGAMSPGPSLAVVVRHSVRGGALVGGLCAVTHGIGIFLWAMLMVSGLGALLVAQPAWFDAIRALGALFLLYLGARALLQNIEEADVRSLAMPRTELEPVGKVFSSRCPIPRSPFSSPRCSVSSSSRRRR